MQSEIAQIEEQLQATLEPVERADLLNRLAGKLAESNPQRALEIAAEALEIAIACDVFTAHARSLLLSAICTNAISDYAASEEFARRLLAICRQNNDRINEANALTAIGIARRGMCDNATAIEMFNESVAIYIEQDDRSRLAAGYNNIGIMHATAGDFAKALDVYLKALRLYEEGSDDSSAAITSGNIAAIYYYLGDMERSFEYHQKSLEVFRRLGMHQSIAIALGNISSFHKDRGDLETASVMLAEALEIFERLGDKRYESTTRARLGMLYSLQGKSNEALYQLNRAVAISTEIGNTEDVTYSEHLIGEHYIGTGQPEMALPPLNRALAIARELGLQNAMAVLHQTLARAHRSAGNLEEAFEHLQEYADLKEKIFGEERQRAMAELQARFDVERVEREREIFRLKSEQLEQTVAQRAKELATLAMHLVQKNTFLEKLRKDTQKLAEQFPDTRDACSTLMREIASNLHDDNEWERFEREFQLVHCDFLQMLAQKYPLLTPTEMKIAALLKINLSNKEITRLLSVSLRNVESHRYAIRKKLGLGSDVNLSSWLARM